MSTGPITPAVPRVVVRYLDGRMIKGTTRDFTPGRPTFHVVPHGDDRAAAVEVTLEPLKAVFFVKSLEGNPAHKERMTFEGVKGTGRRVMVTFVDGETIAGLTTGYSPERQGFFLIPVDPESNNLRIYVLNSAVRKLEWVPLTQPAPVGAPGA